MHSTRYMHKNKKVIFTAICDIFLLWLAYESYSLGLKGELDHLVTFLAAKLVHISRRLRRNVHKGTDHPGRNTDGDGMIWQVLNDKRSSTNLAAVANTNIA